MRMLFEFFEENNIISSLSDDLDFHDKRLLLLNIEPDECYICGHTGSINISLSVPDSTFEEDDLISFYIFGNGEEENSLLLDYCKGNCFIMLELYCEKYPPLIIDFVSPDNTINEKSAYGTSEIRIEESQIMSMDEFKSFLENNSIQGRLNFIEVE